MRTAAIKCNLSVSLCSVTFCCVINGVGGDCVQLFYGRFTVRVFYCLCANAIVLPVKANQFDLPALGIALCRSYITMCSVQCTAICPCLRSLLWISYWRTWEVGLYSNISPTSGRKPVCVFMQLVHNVRLYCRP